MVCVVHFVPVGHTRETLVGGLRRYPVDKVILVLGRDASQPGALEARKTASLLRKDLGSIKCEELFVDIDDVSLSALSLVEKILIEKKQGCEVKINLSGSLRSLNIAAYIAALVTGSHAYIALPDYQKGKVAGIRGVVDVPLIPLKALSEDKREILAALVSGPKNMGDLFREKTKTERSRLSYHIKDLKKDGLVEAEKEGRNLLVKLTFAGRLYALGLEKGYAAAFQ